MRGIAYVRSDGIFNDSRACKEIKTFLKAGYRVFVIGWDRSGHAQEKCIEMFGHNSHLVYYFFNHIIDTIGLKKMPVLLKWFYFIKKTIKKIKLDIDVIHSCNLDTGIPCLKMCNKYNFKLVYDIYDYYIDSHNIPKILINYIEKREIDVINKSNLTIICTEERREQICKATPKDVIVLHNSPQIALIENEIIYDYFYCGVFGGGRLLQEIVNDLEKHDVIFGFAGYGSLSQQLIKLSLGDKLDFFGEVNYDKCLELESKAMCLSAIYNPNKRNHRLAAPNKFYEALALGKPVIVCKNTGIDKIVEEYNIGIVINYNVSEFYEAIDKIKSDKNYRESVKRRARRLYEEKYSWDIMEKRLIDSYDRLF